MCQTHGKSKEVGTQRYLSLVVPLKKVGDEAVHKELGDRMERAATTASSLEAEQDNGSGPRCQDTILGDVDAQTMFETKSKQFNDPPLLKVTHLEVGRTKFSIITSYGDMSHNQKKIYINPRHTKKIFANMKREGNDFSGRITPIFDTMMVQASEEVDAQEDASKQGRRIEDIDADAKVTLFNETQERQDEDLMFDTGVLDGDKMFVDATTGEKDEQSTKLDDCTAGEAVTTAGVEDSALPTIPTTVEEILAQTLIHLTKKDQVAFDEDLARNIQAQLDAEIIEEERLERQKQEEANIALIES
ncbi:hypothetical protein Tco_0588723 [Tanacetum coccineum]